jgi:5-methyltetrahydropteroyltriglutamate--homocysteine methyltransferase
MSAYERCTTTVVGSYTVPDWYPVLEEAVLRGQLDPAIARDAQATAAKAAIKDHELAGIDVVVDGELFRRLNNRHGPPNAMINYFTSKIPGFAKETRNKYISPVDKTVYHPAPIVKGKLEPVPLGLVDELTFLKANTSRPVKIAMTGPHFITKVAWNEHYAGDEELAMALAGVINAELKRLSAAGCDVVQIDEALWVLFPDDLEWAVRAVNACLDGVKSKSVLHICQGNYNPDPTQHVGRRLFTGDYANLFPRLLDVHADLVQTEFHKDDIKTLDLFKRYAWPKGLGFGVVDVQDHTVEKADDLLRRVERALEVVPADRLWITPACGMNHLPRNVAFGKLCVLAETARKARERL